MDAKTLTVYAKRYGKKKEIKPRKPFYHNEDDDEFRRAQDVLMSAHNAWHSLSTWRKDIMRNEEFVYGDQWLDRVYDYKKNEWKTERRLIQEQGANPDQYNILRNIIKVASGVWGNNKTLPVCVAQKDENQSDSETLTATLHALYRKGELWKLDFSQLIQLMISGLAVTKSLPATRGGDRDIFTDYISPYAFFVDNTMKDPRYTNCGLVGSFFDITIDELVSAMANGDRNKARRIRELYRGMDSERVIQIAETFTDQRVEQDFFIPGTETYGMCRVIEVWRKESAECFMVHDRKTGEYYADFKSSEKELKEVNAFRRKEQLALGIEEEDLLLLEWEWEVQTFWKYYYLTPTGDVLDEGMNPYWHGNPPYVFELHEFYVGKIYPFIKDVIDVQKLINTLFAISKLLTKFSAKSLLLFPKEAIDEEEGIEGIEDKLTDYDAVISYNSKPGHPAPNYINTLGQAFTPLNIINMCIQLKDNVSGVYGALQGSTPASGTPAQMYAQQSQNSAMSLVGIFEAINSFRVRRDKMNVQLMQQYYEDERYIYNKQTGKRVKYTPEKIRNIDFEISVVENTDTPAYRLMISELLIQLKQFDVNNVLDLRGMIEVGNFPFKEPLLNYLNKREQQIAEAQAGQGAMPQGELPPELAQQISQYQFTPEVQAQFAAMPQEVQQQVIDMAQRGG